MTDIVSKQTRSRMMSGIQGKNTKPELVVRKALFARGFRYRLHGSKLPGKPDLVLPKYKAVVFVNGCFWHLHECPLFKWPSTRPEFWHEKLTANRTRDKRNLALLQQQGWRVLVIWECALKGRQRRPVDNVIDQATDWLHTSSPLLEISGKPV